MRFLNIGFGNIVSASRIISISPPDSAPMRRLVQDAKEAGRVIDASAGRKTQAVIVTDSDHIVLSALTTEFLESRLSELAAEEDEQQ